MREIRSALPLGLAYGKITEDEFDLAVALGDLHGQQGRLDEAEALFAGLLALPELGPRSTDTVPVGLLAAGTHRRNHAKASEYCLRRFELAQDGATPSSLRDITESCAALLDRAGQRERADAIWARARVRLEQLYADGTDVIIVRETTPLP